MSWLVKNRLYRKIAKYIIFSLVIFFGPFIFCNFGNAQYLGVTSNPINFAIFPQGLSIYSPYEAGLLGYDPTYHPITQFSQYFVNLGRSLPGYGYDTIQLPSFTFGNTVVSPYIVPGVGGGVSGSNLNYNSGFGGLYGGLFGLGRYMPPYGLGSYGSPYGLGSMYIGFGRKYGF